MRYQLDELLAQISNSLILMSSACEESLTNAFDAFKAHDKEKALSIYNKDSGNICTSFFFAACQ